MRGWLLVVAVATAAALCLSGGAAEGAAPLTLDVVAG
jgi:hypothetical protein